MEAVRHELRSEGCVVKDEDAKPLSPLIHEHTSMLGHYSFAVLDAVLRRVLWPYKVQPQFCSVTFQIPQTHAQVKVAIGSFRALILAAKSHPKYPVLCELLTQPSTVQ